MSFSEVIFSFKEMEYVYLLPTVVMIFLAYIFRAYRWKALLEPSLKVNVSELYSPMMVGFMGNFLPARAAEILRPYLLSKKSNISFSAAFASIIMERLFDLIILLLIFSWAFWFEASVFSSDIEFSGFSVEEMAVKFGQICVLAVTMLVIFIYFLLNHKKYIMKLAGWFLGFINENWANKIKHFINEFARGCEVVRNFGTLARISVHSALLWIANIFSIYPLYYAFDLQQKTVFSLLIVAVMISVLITVVPTPGFLGSYNAGIFIGLHEIMGESEAKSVSLGMVGWVLFSGVILAGGLYFVFHEHMSLKNLTRVRTQSDDSFKQNK